MPAITHATITAFYLFDVAEQIDLTALRAAIGGGAINARFTTKSAAPSYLQYSVPPVVVDGDALDIADVDGFKLRVKFFDYGVLSLALSRPFAGEWAALLGLESDLHRERRARTPRRDDCPAHLRTLRRGGEARPDDVPQRGLPRRLDHGVGGADDRRGPPRRARGSEIARLVRGERQPLSRQERDEIMSNRLSYLADDLVVPTWNAAFVYDTEPGVQAALEIFEFANSQLLEFRYYDELLDVELTRIYATVAEPPRLAFLSGRGYVAATRHLHALFIDVNEITDRTENALKMVGDIYSARLFHLTAARLGLASWKASVKDKLETLDDIYRFAVEQLAISRGHFLELVVVLILLFELALFFLGIMT